MTNDKIQKANSGDSLSKRMTTADIRNKFKSPLQQRLGNAANNQQAPPDPATMPNRIALQLDVSGSMSGHAYGKRKIEHLSNAVQSFIAACCFADTAISITTFPNRETMTLPLTADAMHIQLATMGGFEAGGGTPMAQAMDSILKSQSITRAILVSDGQPDSELAVIELAQQYANAEIPIDTVHIDERDHGADVLKRIAETTGGKFIKFDNIGNFAANFKYLTPGYRAMLNAPGAAALIGAKEIK